MNLGLVGKDKSSKQQIEKLKAGDRVKIRTEKFGEKYALGKQEFTHGLIKSIKGNEASVKWDGSSGMWNSHLAHLTRLKPALPSIMIGKDGIWELPEWKPPEGDPGIYGDFTLDDIFDGRDLFQKEWAAECVVQSPATRPGNITYLANYIYAGLTLVKYL